MKIYIGSDHAGFELKGKIALELEREGYVVVDKGPAEYDAEDDYPDFVKPVAEAVSADPESRGIIIGKSGQGEAMCANRVMGVRAAVYYGKDIEVVKLSREHNDSNILSLASGFLSEGEAQEAVRVWLTTSFSGEERHVRRIKKLDNG